MIEAQRAQTAQLLAATRAAGARFGVYYSGALDWHVSDFPPIESDTDLFRFRRNDEPFSRYAAAQLREARVDAAMHGMRLDKALVTLAGEFSRNHLQSLIEAGHLCIDGQVVALPSRKLRAGQQLRLELVWLYL